MFTPAMSVAAQVASDNISDKIIITTEEVLLHESKFKRSSFFNLKIYNNDNVDYKLTHLSVAGTYQEKLPVKELYKYYLKENAFQEDRFPYPFKTHIFAVVSIFTPTIFCLLCATILGDLKSSYDSFIYKPVKSIVLLPLDTVYKVKEGQRNRKIRKELKKYFDMDDIIDYEAIENVIIEPGTELQIPLATKRSFIILKNLETNEEHRFENGKVYFLPVFDSPKSP